MASLHFKDTKTAFPDENASPKKKVQKEWLRDYAQAVFNAADNMPEGSIGYPSRNLYKQWWEYARNQQELQRYIDLSGLDAKNPLFSEASRLPISNRFFNIVVGLVEKAGYKIRVGTIDPQATIELKKKQAERKARLMIRQVAEAADAPEVAQHPMVMAQPGEPNDLEGLEIMAMGERLPICADAQDIIRAVFNTNKYDRIRRELIQWLFIAGAGVTKDDTEPHGITARICELGDIVMNYCRYPDFRDLRHIGEIRTVPISALAEMSCGEISKAELEDLYKQGNTNNWYTADTFHDYDGWMGSAKVQVLDLEILSTDTTRKEEYRNREGNLRYRDVVVKKDGTEKEVEGSKKVDLQIQNVYRVKWVVGTDIVFDYGKQVNIKRDGQNPAKAYLSYHIVAPNIREMIPYSRMAAIIPMVDDIQVMNLKRRWTLSRAVPSGYAINLDALEDIDLTGGGQSMTKERVLDLFVRTGNLIYRERAVNGSFKGGNSKPLEFIKGGIGDEVVEYSNQIAYNVDLIRQTLGLNEVTDGSTVNAKNLNSTNQAMQIGTNNALSDIYFSDKQMAEMLSQSVLLRAQDLVRPDTEGKTRKDDLARIVGWDSTKRIGEAPRLDAHTFGITIEDAPTAAEEEDFNASLNLALQSGQISIDERFMAKNIADDNILQAQLYLSYRVRKNKEEAQAEAARREQSNAQLQMQSAQAAEQAKQQTLQVEFELKSQLSQQEHAQNMELGGQTGGFTLERERIAGTGRVGASAVQADERAESNVRDNQTKLIKEGREDVASQIQRTDKLLDKLMPLTSEEQPALPKAAFRFNNIQPTAPMPQQDMGAAMPQEQMMEQPLDV